MGYLLDTHVLLWWLFDDPRLPSKVRGVLSDPSRRVFVSSASAWEIATKHRLGKLDSATPLILDFAGWLRKAGFVELPITVAHAARAGGWDIAHRDPFDRMLAAQSTLENLRLASSDAVFADFGLETIW